MGLPDFATRLLRTLVGDELPVELRVAPEVTTALVPHVYGGPASRTLLRSPSHS